MIQVDVTYIKQPENGELILNNNINIEIAIKMRILIGILEY